MRFGGDDYFLDSINFAGTPMDVKAIGGAVLERALELLGELGLSLDDIHKVRDEISSLAEIILDPESSDEAREAAQRSLQGIPIRLKQQLAALQKNVLDKVMDIVSKVVGIVSRLVAFL